MMKKRLLPSLIPELCCSDICKSINFYTEILGFNIQYQRAEEGFAMLERQDSFLMLDEMRSSKRVWLAAPLEPPFGRGINFEIRTMNVDKLYHHIQQYNVPIFLPIEDKWYQAGDDQIGNRQFIVLDPDGYMLRFAQSLNELQGD